MLLGGIGVAGYRSFAPDMVQVLGPLSDVNLLVGQNNAGKSNLLDFCEYVFTKAGAAVDEDDVPQGIDPGELRLRILVPHDHEAYQQFTERLRSHHTLRDVLLGALQKGGGSLPELPLAINRGSGTTGLDLDRALALTSDIPDSELAELSRTLTSHTGEPRANVTNVFAPLVEKVSFPTVHKVPAFRRIEAGEKTDQYGSGLINELRKLERPPKGSSYKASKKRFEDIQHFIQRVFDDDGVTLEVPSEADTINIIRNGEALPLERYGTGFQQVVMLAAAAVLNEDALLLIEEPEVHLHPLLQRQFLRFLATQEQNQYLIATHSAHMLDSDIASIFHIKKVDGWSRIERISQPGEIADAAAELGYRASDLVQSNAVVWVEGPSDRTYVNHWIAAAAPDLVEGLHYSVMFYGGALLSELSTDEEEVDDLIKLQRLNRNVAILIDSDTESPSEPSNDSKRRVIKQTERNGGFAWVTYGYTIENYVPPAILSAASSQVHPRKGRATTNKDMKRDPFRGRVTSPRKSAIAKVAIEHWEDPLKTDVRGDLAERVAALVGFIRDANSGVSNMVIAAPDLEPEPAS